VESQLEKENAELITENEHLKTEVAFLRSCFSSSIIPTLRLQVENLKSENEMLKSQVQYLQGLVRRVGEVSEFVKIPRDNAPRKFRE
jgi:hypothetical protein